MDQQINMDKQMKKFIFNTHLCSLRNLIASTEHCISPDNLKAIPFFLGVLKNYIELWKTYNQETSPPEDIQKEVQSLVDSLENVLQYATNDKVMSESTALQNGSEEKKKQNKNRQKRKGRMHNTESPIQSNESFKASDNVKPDNGSLKNRPKRRWYRSIKNKNRYPVSHTDLPNPYSEVIDKLTPEIPASNSIKEQQRRGGGKVERQNRKPQSDAPMQTSQITGKVIYEVTNENGSREQKQKINTRRRMKRRQKKEEKDRMLPTDDDGSILNVISKAIAESKKKQIRSARVISVLKKFANALAMYANYGKSCIIDLYEMSMLSFSEIPSLEDLQSKDFSAIMYSVHQITNTICREYPKYHIPPEDVIHKMNLLVEAIEIIINKEEKTTKESMSSADSHLIISSTNLFSVIISQPNQDMIELTKQKLTDYNASMLIPESNEGTMKLEFPDILSFVSFAQNNQVLMDGLNLVSKEQDSVPKRILGAKKQLNEQCMYFIQSEENILKKVKHQLEQSEECMKSKTVHTELLSALSEVIETVYPGHKLHIFGSRATGQALPDSDFDFYCDITGCSYLTGLEHSTQKVVVGVLGTQLRKIRSKFSRVISLVNARVPIIKLIHIPTGMNCDISFRDGTSVENTNLLNVYLQLDPRVHWILTAVKLWAYYNQMHGSRYFTSHGLSWLVLFYLMNGKLVPPVMDLQVSCEPKIINNWNVAFQHPKQWVPGTQASALELFRGFFNWVANADLMKYCLSTFTGDAIPKESFSNIEWMKNYKGGAYREYAERLEMERPTSTGPLSSYDKIEMNGLCVQDPFEHCKNTTTLVKDILLENFLWASRETSSVLNRMDLKLVNEACVNFEELNMN